MNLLSRTILGVVPFGVAFGVTGCSSTVDSSTVGKQSEQVPSRPNIIYILADDLGYGDLGCYGQTQIVTPNLDRMSAKGMRFTQHYSGSTVCAPSRSCLLIGKHTGHTNLRGNGSGAVLKDPQDIVVPRLLKKAGYHSAMIGKSGLSSNTVIPGFAAEKGFDHFFGYLSHTDAHFYYPGHLWRNGKQVEYPENKTHSGPNYSSAETSEDVLNYIEEQKNGPFFLHYACQIPHRSLRAPEEFKAKYRGKFQEPTDSKQHWHYTFEKEPKTTYAAMVSYLDYNVGRILDKLEELGIAENTLVIFASDNGGTTAGQYNVEWFKSNGNLRGEKRDLYEGGIRVPMIAYWPGVIKPGQTSDHVSAFWDFLPTACELAGVEVPDNVDGISMVPELTNTGTQKKHDFLYWEFHERGGKLAVRMGKWKAVANGVKSQNRIDIELYDLEKDLSEKNNVASEHPEIVAKALATMKREHTPSHYSRFNIPQLKN